MTVEHHSEELTVTSPMEGPPPGTVLLDKYRVDWMLGVGGYGYVVKAQHLEHGGSVAIKIMRDDREADPASVGRFEREGRLVVQLESEHVARVFDVGKLPTGAPYMVMELLEGSDLRKVLESGPLKITQAVDYLLQACEALAEAHGRGIVHRDIKPGNLFLARLPAKRSAIKVLDFGISKSAARYDKRLTQTQSILGTPAYMSPEQMRDPRNVDFATDIWALGAVLYELVEGRLPFDADNFAELVIAVSTEPMRPMQLAPELEPVLERCLAKSVINRYGSIAHLASAIAPFGTPSTSRDYVARIHRLLGHTAPPDDEEIAARRFISAGTPPPPTATAPPQPVVVTTNAATQPQPVWEDALPRRKLWIPVAVIAALATVIVVVALVALGGSTPTEEPTKPLEIIKVEQKTEPQKPEPQKPESQKPEPQKPEPPKSKPPQKPVDVAKAPDVKKPPQIKKVPAGAGSAKTTPVIPPVVNPGVAKNGICPDGTPVAKYMDGKCRPPKK